MQTDYIVRLLIEERDKLNRAIEALGGTTTAKRRGRPPKTAVETTRTLETIADSNKSSAAPKKRTWTPAQKKAAAERMAAHWAAKKKVPAKKVTK